MVPMLETETSTDDSIEAAGESEVTTNHARLFVVCVALFMFMSALQVTNGH